MPRRNHIAKILGLGASSLALAVIALACPPPIFPTYKVPASFRVLLKNQSQPMTGVRVNLYREEGANHLTRSLLLSPVSDANGSVQIQNLSPGNYFVETTGNGAGDAAHVVVQAASSGDIRDVIELKWPARGPLSTKALAGRFVSSDPHSPFTSVDLKLWTKDGAAPAETIHAGPGGEFAFKASEPGLYFLYVSTIYHNRLLNREEQGGGQFPVQLSPGDSGALETLDLSLTDTSCGLMTQPLNSTKPETHATPQ